MDEEFTDLAEIFFVFFAIVLAIMAIWFVFTAIGNYKVFKKMGKPGWQGIVPFYSAYVKFEEVWEVKYFWIYFIMLTLYLIVQQSKMTGIIPATISLGSLVSDIILVIMNVKLAEKFNRGAGFGIGLFFLAPIFYMILGFNKDIYQNQTDLFDPYTVNNQYDDNSTF